MGISPFYRGTDCNFWAMYDDRPDYVGATIHRLTKGLDSGPILYYAFSEYTNDPFVYTMSTVKSAIISLKKPNLVTLFVAAVKYPTLFVL